ncbi:EsaB/YukD family protein [Shouchella lonarensis]|uniref:Uncharacterized ubiquitin-like protein YukD n=1 Tax=Shouchella lonarensis TaxID=1464122 RepID=A0A1G6HZV5_9BACI|nr:EsaB/YukD family protein [Shouchella lonarensis]SDB99730.1 Uncharacterized ubiquitin-like protein YukD [Shouchella lonarensis]
MYIQVTIDMRRYNGKQFDLRLSDQYTAKKVVDTVWKIEQLSVPRREGSWLRIQNKARTLSGHDVLAESYVTSGDRLEVL